MRISGSKREYLEQDQTQLKFLPLFVNRLELDVWIQRKCSLEGTLNWFESLDDLLQVEVVKKCMEKRSALDELEKCLEGSQRKDIKNWIVSFKSQNVNDIIDGEVEKVILEVVDKIRRTFNGRMVIAKNNWLNYFVQETNVMMNPLSHFCYSKSQANTINFQDYHTQKGFDIKNVYQPLFLHGFYPNPRRYERVKDIDLSEICSKKETYLIPELCDILGVTVEVFNFGLYIPYVIQHMQSYLKIECFLEQTHLNIFNKRLLKKVGTMFIVAKRKKANLFLGERL